MNYLLKFSFPMAANGLRYAHQPAAKGGYGRPWLWLVAWFLAAAPALTAQHNLLLYGLDRVPQSNLLNPGQIPTADLHIGLPVLSGVRLGGGHAGFTYHQYDQALMTDGYDFHYPSLLEGLRSGENRFAADSEVRFFSLGLRRGKNYFSIDVGDQLFAGGQYTPDVLNMFEDIQQNRFGPETADTLYDQSQHGLSAIYYRSYSVGYARQICDDLSVGGRFRYLQGVAAAMSENNGLMFRYPGDGDYFEILGQSTLYGAGLNVPEDASLLSTLFPGGNTGFAFDIGAKYRVNDRIEVSFSAVNLGRIKWKTNVNYQMVGNYSMFSAVDIEDHLERWGDLLEDLTEGESNGNTGLYFMTPLPQRFYLGGNYRFDANTTAGLLINPVRFNGMISTAVAVSGHRQLGEVFGLSAALSYNQYTPVNLGIGATVDLGVVQLYAISDNLLGAFNWKNSHAAQAQFGLNLNFGGRKKDDMPDEFDPIALDETGADTLDFWPAPPSNAQPDPLDSPRRSSAPTPAMSAADGPITLTGTARDLETGLPLQGIQVEVYKMTDTGDRELNLIKSFLNGQLSVTLDRDATYQIVVDKPGYDPTEMVLSRSQLQSGGFDPARDVLLRKTPPPAPKPTPVVPAPANTETPPVAETFSPPAVVPEENVSQPETPVVRPPDNKQPATNTLLAPELGVYRLTAATSFRQGPTHTTGVILRFKIGDQVEVLERTNEWWWKVRYGEQTGYVKAQALTQ